MKLNDLFEKKIAILGCDVEGKATYFYLKKHGIKAAILDKLETEVFYDKNPELKTEKIEVHLGSDYLDCLTRFEIVFKTPGVRFFPEVRAAIKQGVVITSQMELFFDLCPASIIGVTGTKGKGTTSTLIYEILKKSNFDVYLGGNIGTPAISFLDNLTDKSKVVLELSSFQLELLKTSPDIAVVLNVTQDHLDHHKDVREYREAKKNIIRYQEKNDFAVVNADYKVPKEFAKETKAATFYFSKQKATNGCYVDASDQILLVTKEGIIQIAKARDLKLRGRHNLENITAAVAASHLAGANIESIRKTVLAFSGLEHRLELVKEIGGVKYYNDSFSTTPETAIAAINSFDEPIILILGGSDKGSDYTELGREIEKSKVKSLILIGDMSKKISKAVGNKFTGQRIFGLTTMEEIVDIANTLAENGDVVLLSPACASFGLFENYKDRGNQFKKIVNSLHK